MNIAIVFIDQDDGANGSLMPDHRGSCCSFEGTGQINSARAAQPQTPAAP
jgi:hypothetical protein